MHKPQLPSLPCLCATLRRGARALTQTYQEEMRPLGITSSQLTVLQVFDRAGEVSQGTLAAILAMDSTTLTRTLKVMARNGWIAERQGEDRRERRLRLSRAGEAQLKRALPAWEKAQSRIRRHLGNEAWEQLLTLANRVTEFASTQPSSHQGDAL
jgi:DNA-binding MarR family transcriptional regulator